MFDYLKTEIEKFSDTEQKEILEYLMKKRVTEDIKYICSEHNVDRYDIDGIVEAFMNSGYCFGNDYYNSLTEMIKNYR